jgi:hypothetical protein
LKDKNLYVGKKYAMFAVYRDKKDKPNSMARRIACMDLKA